MTRNQLRKVLTKIKVNNFQGEPRQIRQDIAFLAEAILLLDQDNPRKGQETHYKIDRRIKVNLSK